MVVAQLVERLLPNPEVRSSNPVIGKNLFTYLTFVCCQLCIEKTKIREKEAGNGPFLKKVIISPKSLSHFIMRLLLKYWVLQWYSTIYSTDAKSTNKSSTATIWHPQTNKSFYNIDWPPSLHGRCRYVESNQLKLHGPFESKKIGKTLSVLSTAQSYKINLQHKIMLQWTHPMTSTNYSNA